MNTFARVLVLGSCLGVAGLASAQVTETGTELLVSADGFASAVNNLQHYTQTSTTGVVRHSILGSIDFTTAPFTAASATISGSFGARINLKTGPIGAYIDLIEFAGNFADIDQYTVPAGRPITSRNYHQVNVYRYNDINGNNVYDPGVDSTPRLNYRVLGADFGALYRNTVRRYSYTYSGTSVSAEDRRLAPNATYFIQVDYATVIARKRTSADESHVVVWSPNGYTIQYHTRMAR